MPKGERLAHFNKERAAQARKVQLNNYQVTKNSCWIWKGTIGTDGYGKLKRHGRTIRAHRFFYAIHIGEIPKDLFVCHKCDTPSCVNPEHLFLGTHLENEQDKTRKGRRPRSPTIVFPECPCKGEAVNTAKLTEEKVLFIRTSKHSSKVLAEMYKVHVTTIQNVRALRTWKHL